MNGVHPYPSPTGPWRPPVPPPADGSGMRTVGKGMTLIGVLIAAVSIGALVAGFFAIEAMVTRGTAESVEVRSVTPVVLFEGESRWLDADGARGPQTRCSVTGPRGERVQIDWFSEYDDTPRRTRNDIGVFTAPADGEHLVSCAGPGTYTLAPGPDFITVIVASLVGVGALLGAMFGPGLVVLGVILWLIGRSQAKRATAQM